MAKVNSMEISEEFVPKRFPQLLATLAVATSAFSFGCVLVWTSPSIPDLERKGTLGVLTLEEKSWIASLVMLGALLCGPCSGYIVDKLGRRTGLQIMAIVMTVGWSLIATGLSVQVMCVGRFLTGFAIGGNIHITAVYISEISEEKIRGILMSLTYVECALGILYTYILGTFVSWQTLTLTNIPFPIISFFSLCFIHESPVYLIMKGKKTECEKALMWLRGADNVNQIQTELHHVQELCQQSSTENEKQNNVVDNMKMIFLSKNNLSALSIVLGLMICQQLSGINAVLFFAMLIFETSGTGLDPNLCSIILGIVIMFAVFINLVLIDRLGRRVLLIISETGMALSLCCLGVFFYLKKENGGVTPEGLSLLPLLSLVAFVVIYNVGAGPIPWLMMGEILPPEIKRFGCAFATSFNCILGFLVTKYFETLVSILDKHVCYFIFSGICVIGAIFCAACAPETKNKSLNQIQMEYFSK